MTNCNFTNSRVTLNDYNRDNGQFLAMTSSSLDNCNFINTSSNHHGGAICMASGNNNVTNSNFINVTSWIAAVFCHGLVGDEKTKKSMIENCTFVNCSASEVAGAIGTSQENLTISNCKFINNTAPKGAAIMVGGMEYGKALAGDNTHANNVTILDCYILDNNGTLEGGSVHITGNDTKILNSNFTGNIAMKGNGSAVYILGSRTLVEDSLFYNQESARGTIFIIGDHSNITDSTFRNNVASIDGAAVYIRGNNTQIDKTQFVGNTAELYGGAVYIEGDNSIITASNFNNNNVIPKSDSSESGLGGALFIVGNNNTVNTTKFTYNTARNGSAIYTIGKKFSLNSDWFYDNQAWSYVLDISVNPKLSYYNTEDIFINITFRGGDNIINAIYNNATVNDISFYNVSYNSSSGPKITNDLHPVEGVINSDNGKHLYQDDLEDNQYIKFNVNNSLSGILGVSDNMLLAANPIVVRTNIYGQANITIPKGSLPVGKYIVDAIHENDTYYTYISNADTFEILPYADLEITKEAVGPTFYYEGDTITWRITVTNNGPFDAENVTVTDILPSQLKYINSTATKGSYNDATGLWTIGDLTNGSSVNIIINTLVSVTERINITNVANVASDTHDPNETNNKNNDSVSLGPLTDLAIVKEVKLANYHVGDLISWIITVTNNGPDTAYDTIVKDILPEGIKFVSCNDTNYNSASGVWYIGDLDNKDSISINIITKVTSSNLVINNFANVTSKTNETNKDNNEDNASVIISPEADLVIVKKANKNVYKVGDKVVWIITVINNGPDKAKDVIVKDLFKGEFDYKGSKVSKGNFEFLEGTWTIGDLDVGEKATIKIVVTALKEGKLPNFANVFSDTYDPDESNNKDSAIVKIVADNPSDKQSEDISFKYHYDIDVESSNEMHATGNPILLVLLSLMSIVGVSLRKKQ